MNKIFIKDSNSADTLWQSVNKRMYCHYLCLFKQIAAKKVDYIQVATRVVEDAIRENKIEFDKTISYQKKQLIKDIALECEFFVKDYSWFVCKNMKAKTKKFKDYIEQFSKPNTFQIASFSDAFGEANKINDNKYIIKCVLNNCFVVIEIADIPHKMSTYSIISIDNKYCNNAHDIPMNDIDSHNNFLTFAYYLKLVD